MNLVHGPSHRRLLLNPKIQKYHLSLFFSSGCYILATFYQYVATGNRLSLVQQTAEYIVRWQYSNASVSSTNSAVSTRQPKWLQFWLLSTVVACEVKSGSRTQHCQLPQDVSLIGYFGPTWTPRLYILNITREIMLGLLNVSHYQIICGEHRY